MTFNPDEARDAQGRWTSGADGGVERHLLDPRVVDVSGDEWNRKTAERLEKEYAAVRPEIDAIATEGVEKGASVDTNPDEDEDEDTGAPETWGDLSGSQQEEAEQAYKDGHIDQEKEWVVNNWTDNGDPIYEAKHQLSADDDFKSEFLSEYLADRDENEEPRIPFKMDDLMAAIEIKPGDSYDDDPEITFNEKYLDKPDTLDHEQMTLPGIEPQKGSDFLTKDMRRDLEGALIDKFNEEAKSKAENIDPPDYLNEEAENNVQEAWGNMSDEEQFEYAKDHVEGLDDQIKDASAAKRDTTNLAWPAKFDPLNKTSGANYVRTQALAKYIADKRGAQLIAERVPSAMKSDRNPMGAPSEQAMLKELQLADLQLWSGWKGSSTNSEGRLLQVAASDELGGRIREAPPASPEDVALAEIVNKAGYNGKIFNGKANAKSIISNSSGDYTPEDKAFAQKYYDDHKFSVGDIDKSTPTLNTEEVNGFIRLPDVKIEKNGAASTTVSPTVANGWKGTVNNAPEGINKKESIEYANKQFAAIGGYEGVKAAIRAKWETTQYLLDKADIPVVQAYRGISMEHKLKGAVEENEFNPPVSGFQKTDYNGEVDLKDIVVGAAVHTASGKTITKVSAENPPHMSAAQGYKEGIGTWKYSQPKETAQRIVLRTEVPRTAVVSVPAYGVNVQSEQEVVIVGTGWKGWDAWSGKAPTFEEVPMGEKARQEKADRKAAKLSKLDEEIAGFAKQTKEMAAT